jgi:hypothetical protein
MRIYIQAVDYELWRVISRGPRFPRDKEGKLKDEKDWDDADLKLMSLNSKAMNVLYCALDANEFNRISGCDTAKEIWDKLEVSHEGTNQVKENKISMLVHNYELFKMKSDETISSMFTRFTDIINGLKSLGKEYTNVEMVRKILRCLPKSWEPKVTAIQEAKDLTKLSLDELMGSLMTHEMNQVKEDEDEGRRKRGIALKATCSSEDESSEDEDEEFALFTKKFKKFFRKKQGDKRFPRKTHFKGDSSKKNEIICFGCKKPGHIKSDCPNLETHKKSRDFKSKKKAFLAAWGESDESSSESDEEAANLCLMAKGDED